MLAVQSYVFLFGRVECSTSVIIKIPKIVFVLKAYMVKYYTQVLSTVTGGSERNRSARQSGKVDRHGNLENTEQDTQIH